MEVENQEDCEGNSLKRDVGVVGWSGMHPDHSGISPTLDTSISHSKIHQITKHIKTPTVVLIRALTRT